MSQSYRLTATAQRHIEAIGEFVAAENIDAALKIYDAFEAAFAMLGAMPEMGHSRQDLTDRPTIVAVLHGARDVERVLKTVQ